MGNRSDYKLSPFQYQFNDIAEILFITSYPPRECGIATYSQDLIKAINNKFSNAFSIEICALESGDFNYNYPVEVKYTLKTSIAGEYQKLAIIINEDAKIEMVLIQHEFGFFKEQEKSFLQFLSDLKKPVIVVFHTVLPAPDKHLKSKIKNIASACSAIIVMTNNSAKILADDYGISTEKIDVIAHGTHLVPHLDKEFLKTKFGLQGRKVLSTFGLLSSGKNIETTLQALPAIIKTIPNVMFLIIGKTHPEVVKNDGEEYRDNLESIVIQNRLTNNVKFVNNYLALPDLLEYLQLTDIYLFTSNDPFQAVSGTFAYAMSCACPIISTPIPHAKEVLTEDTGIIFDFGSSTQLADGVIRLFNDEQLRKNLSINTLQKIVSTSWENSAISHALLFEKVAGDKNLMQYNLPAITLNHLKKMTTNDGIIQFSKINQPDIDSGYTLDDNARALITISMHYKLTCDEKDLIYIDKYLRFINQCQLPDGSFLNFVDKNLNFTDQNYNANLDDANGRALWALGYLISVDGLLPGPGVFEANEIIKKAIPHIENIHSTRAMAFAIKGLCYRNSIIKSKENISLVDTFASRLVQMFRHVSTEDWCWFEGYLTYANSILPESMLYAWMITGKEIYREVAISSFRFLLSKIFNENGIEVISNKGWLQKGQDPVSFGEQPIDVAYTIIALSTFYDIFKEDEYRVKMEIAFNWFLGKNRLHQIIYNPCTGGCHDGLEEHYVNLNQGAESTLSYLMARLILEKYKKANRKSSGQLSASSDDTLIEKAGDYHSGTVKRTIFASKSY